MLDDDDSDDDVNYINYYFAIISLSWRHLNNFTSTYINIFKSQHKKLSENYEWNEVVGA